MGRVRAGLIAVLALAGSMALAPTAVGRAAPAKGGDDAAAHWTAARMKAATPRDLVLDDRGLAYVEQSDGTLAPHGHSVRQLHGSARASRPTAGKPPSGGGDTSGPTVGPRSPLDGATIGASATFTATVSDPSGVRSVSFVIVFPSGSTQSFATSANGTTYSTTLSGFTDGEWGWYVVAKDGASRGGNTTIAPTTHFTVDTGRGGGGGGGGDDDVANAEWPGTGTVQTAAGRIYFEMPANSRLTRWNGYVCSGTVAEDGVGGRAVIITAAHCVYDDVYKAFARNVLFIPNQSATTGAGTDLNCDNDQLGCWSPSVGVVDVNWANRTFPANIPWDYAYYVVPDSGAHKGAGTEAALGSAAGDLPVLFTSPTDGAVTRALGYSYSDDPNFMYCSEPLGVESDYSDWWLGQCGLSGGASGGPWEQGTLGGEGPIISVNSWGYTNQPGMGGPRLTGRASCVFEVAKVHSTSGGGAVVTTCPAT